MTQPVIVGAVLYDPKVSVIWDIIRDFFESHACPMDVVFYTNYELQVRALVGGHLDIAWNSPLAWLDAQRVTGGRCRAVAMRDTDRDRVSHLVVRRDSGIRTLTDLRAKVVALGARDSPQATLIPLGLLEREGLVAGRDFEARRFDVLVGKHGDHVGGELQAFRCLQAGQAQASALLDLNWNAWTADGTIDPRDYRVLFSSDPFDHCVFTVRQDFPAGVLDGWLNVLFSMSYDDPKHREMMDLEGLREWLPGRVTGFAALADAVAQQGFFRAGGR